MSEDIQASDRNAIRKVFEQDYAKYVSAKDLQGYGDMYTTDALRMPPGVPDLSGKEAIKQEFLAQTANQDIHPVLTADEIQVMGDFGYVIGTAMPTIYPKDGSPAKQFKFRGVWLTKKEQGHWKIDRQIWNEKPL